MDDIGCFKKSLHRHPSLEGYEIRDSRVKNLQPEHPSIIITSDSQA